MNIIIYIVAAAIGLYFSLLGIVFALVARPLFGFIIGALLVATHIGSFLYVRKKAMEGKGRLAALALVSPMFVVGGGGMVIVLGIWAVSFAVSFFEPDSPAFTSECRTAGAQFYKLPTSPVHSIAYDWDGKYAPPITHFTLGFGGYVSSMGSSDSYSDHVPYPSAIEFTERKLRPDRGEWLPAGAPGPYVRFPRQDPFYGITTLTADVLVTYQLTPTEELKTTTPQQGIVTYDLTVTDRRNGEKLASLRYVIDERKNLLGERQNRACGSTGGTTMNERVFVLKAVGVQ